MTHTQRLNKLDSIGWPKLKVASAVHQGSLFADIESEPVEC